jgi:predicted methyltransferase
MDPTKRDAAADTQFAQELPMKPHGLLLIAFALIAGSSLTAEAANGIPAYIAAAVADSARPVDDKAQDVNRKPAEVLAFTGIKPEDKVVDLMPGGGYYTRIFSKVVGPKGKVYALQPVEMDKAAPYGLQSLKSFAGTPDYPNVAILLQPAAAITVPEQVDMIWTSQNYHDLHDPFMGSPDMAKFDKAIFAALKPGGIFLVLDHVAPDGSGLSDTDTLHRIDPGVVKAEATAAGFEFVGESKALRNPADDHTLSIYNKSIKGKTDKFVYKFRKPAH